MLMTSQGRLDRCDALRLSGSNLHSTQKLLRDLFHRMVTLEQKMRQLEISNEQVKQEPILRFFEFTAMYVQRQRCSRLERFSN
jgi:hypothetical protein